MSGARLPRDRLVGLPPARLPDPSGHARRQREATARQAQPNAARLLWVETVNADGTAVLRDAEGTVIDEDVATAGGRLDPGDRGARLGIPGTGHRAAAPSYLAVGPLAAVRTPPLLTPGPAMGTAPTGITIAGSDDYARIAFTTGAAPTPGGLLTLTWSGTG